MMNFKELKALDKKLIWHPYTQMKDFETKDLLFVKKAKGVFLFDDEDKKYFDTISSWWCIVHGHNHPIIKDKIIRQLERLDQIHFAGTTHEGPILLCKELTSYLPDKLCKFFFSDNGSTAVEVALKMSIQYWKQTGNGSKCTFASLQRGYHGDTIGTMSLGGVPAFEGPFDDLLFDSIKIPPPYCYRCPIDNKLYNPETGRQCNVECFDFLDKELTKHADKICALVLEPLLMGAGGMLCYPESYLKKARTLCNDLNIHLIFDEVATGFGRTGKMFAFEHAEVCPDFLCLSKGITGGTLPLAVTVTSKDIFDAFYADYNEGKTFFHGHTFTANPICTASALGSLEIFKKENVVSKGHEIASYLQKKKKALLNIDIVGDARGLGFVAAFELVSDKKNRKSFDSNMRIGWQVYLEGLKRGLILRPLSDVTYLFLPLCITKEQIDEILKKTEETIKQVSANIK